MHLSKLEMEEKKQSKNKSSETSQEIPKQKWFSSHSSCVIEAAQIHDSVLGGHGGIPLK